MGKLDRMSDLVHELVEQKVDFLVVVNQVAIRAAKKLTKTIPVVMVRSVDPVMAAHVDSCASQERYFCLATLPAI